jgi:hypothetical protein
MQAEIIPNKPISKHLLESHMFHTVKSNGNGYICVDAYDANAGFFLFFFFFLSRQESDYINVCGRVRCMIT